MNNYMKPLSLVRVTRIARITLIILSGLALMSLTQCNKAGNSGHIIHNDIKWVDTDGNEIFCQGGSMCKFGDTYYFYGWADYPGDNRYDKITCYSSKNLVTWKFENSIYERDMTDTTLIVPDRLHVLYNETTGKYVMIGKHILPVLDPAIPHQPRVTGGVSFFTCSNPTGKFDYLGHVNLPEGTGTNYHRDLSAFKDSDGRAYVVSAHDQHDSLRKNIMITLLSSDYLSIDKVICEVPVSKGFSDKGKESPYMIKMNGKYWLFTSGHGPNAWGSSPTYYSSASSLTGPWTEFRLVLTSPTSANTHDSQNAFLFEVKGSNGSFILWAGDRWSQRTPADDNSGKNVWLPLQWKGEEPLLKWYQTWNVDAVEGRWIADSSTSSKLPVSAQPIVPDAISAVSDIPQITGDWRTLAVNPNIGGLTGPKQQPVDFTIWQAADGTWQLWSCIRNTKIPGATRSSRLFHRWQTSNFNDPDWTPMGVAFQADPAYGEEVGSIWSPFVVKIGSEYNLFYGGWVDGAGDVSQICRATSVDGKTFTRVVGPDGKSGIFSEGNGNFIRDPMVRKLGDTFYCYYTASLDGGQESGKGFILCRTSTDLKTWSEPSQVAHGGAAGTNWKSAECPFVLEHGGWYYLYRTQVYQPDSQESCLYSSKDPMNFGINDNRFLLDFLPLAAPEIIEAEGQTYLACLESTLQGIRIVKLEWVKR